MAYDFEWIDKEDGDGNLIMAAHVNALAKAVQDLRQLTLLADCEAVKVSDGMYTVTIPDLAMDQNLAGRVLKVYNFTDGFSVSPEDGMMYISINEEEYWPIFTLDNVPIPIILPFMYLMFGEGLVFVGPNFNVNRQEVHAVALGDTFNTGDITAQHNVAITIGTIPLDKVITRAYIQLATGSSIHTKNSLMIEAAVQSNMLTSVKCSGYIYDSVSEEEYYGSWLEGAIVIEGESVPITGIKGNLWYGYKCLSDDGLIKLDGIELDSGVVKLWIANYDSVTRATTITVSCTLDSFGPAFFLDGPS